MKKGYSTRALTIKFFRMAEGELKAAEGVAKKAGVVEHRIFDIPSLREAGDIGGSVFAGLPSTYIPMRNAVFYALAAAYAEEVGANYVLGGHNQDDLGIFEDTSRKFFDDLQRALWSGSSRLKKKRTTLLRPLQRMSKGEVVAYASRLNVPLGLTWSCHREGTEHCWECDGCRARVEAFKRAGVEDPLKR
jgi:7-cyano-7-deazaguanine synthase